MQQWFYDSPVDRIRNLPDKFTTLRTDNCVFYQLADRLGQEDLAYQRRIADLMWRKGLDLWLVNSEDEMDFLRDIRTTNQRAIRCEQMWGVGHGSITSLGPQLRTDLTDPDGKPRFPRDWVEQDGKILAFGDPIPGTKVLRLEQVSFPDVWFCWHVTLWNGRLGRACWRRENRNLVEFYEKPQQLWHRDRPFDPVGFGLDDWHVPLRSWDKYGPNGGY